MNTKFVLMFSFFIAIYVLIHIYLFVRGWQALPDKVVLKSSYIGIFLLFSLSFIIGMTLGDKFPVSATTVIQRIGFVWLGAMVYFLLITLALDLVRLFNHFFHFYPQLITSHYPVVKIACLGISVLLVSTLLLVGYIRYRNPKVQNLSLAINKNAHQFKRLKIVAVSDIHLGYMIQKEQLAKYIDEINELNPDLVLMAGDVVDRSIKPLKERKIGSEFKNIKAPLGVYAVLGNHEYIGGLKESEAYLKNETGIKLLRDTSIKINNSFYIIGRDDRTNSKRKSLQSLTDTLDKTLPLILLDHQPYDLGISEACGIDLQISGHTHNGQLWPFSLLIKRMYEIPYGYKQKGNTNIYVTSGLGLWGPPFRIGSVSEICLIDLQFSAN